MSRTYYQIYKEQTFVLARTLIVKHEEIASSMNTELYYRGYTIDSNPYNWRYYLNLSGEYHQADKDELYEKYGTQYMMVKIPSLLGSVEVPLTKDLLHGTNADKTMMNEYQIGSKFYEELVSRYPEFETLIIGIINPIDIDVALNADNGEILFIAGRYKRITATRKYFDTTWFSINEVLIEEQEDNLILELQKFINTFLKHWSNPEYINGNDLYVVAMLGVLYSNIPNALFNIRLGNCKTPRAHTFHIRQYLESFGQIGRYVDFIPIGTILWLYKNVHYLEANAGKQKTFDLIMDNMLTPNEIPMSAYTARHELSNMGNDKLLPTSMLYKEVLNFSIVGASDDDRTVLDILEDQIDLARDNDKDLLEKEKDIQTELDWGGDDRLNTKVLESEMIDIGEPYPFTLSQMLFNLWGYTVVKGYYTGTAYATNPLTGDRLSFNSKSAYILAMYCLNKSVAGVELKRIPKIKLYGVPRTDQPDDYPTDTRFSKKPDIDKMMSWCVNDVTRRLKVLEVRGTHIPQFNALDSEKFFDNVEEMYLERVRRYNTYCDVENLEERGDLELVAKRLYWLGFEETLLDMDYEQWFRTVGFDPSGFTDDDLLGIGLELVASATGVSEQDDVRKKWLQKSLLAILKHFISYTVHVIEKYTDGVVAYLEGQTLRYSNFQWTYIEPLQAYYSVAIDYELSAYASYNVRFDISNIFENTNVSVNTSSRVPMDLSNMGYEQRRYTLDVGTYALETKLFNIEFNTEKQEPVYITVIDDSINTIIITPFAGNMVDENFIYTMSSEHSFIKPYDINGVITDLNRIVNQIDVNKYGVVVDGTFAEVIDSPKGVGGRRNDSGSITPHGMYAGTSDASISASNDPDYMAVTLDSMCARVNDVNLDVTNNIDDNVIEITDLSAKVVDNNIYNQHVDTSVIDVTGISIGFADPQIPPVDNVVDTSNVVVGSIIASSDDVMFMTYGQSSNAMMLHGILVDVLEDSIELEVDTDTHVAIIGNISGNIVDVNDVNDTLDSSTLIVSNINVDIIDTVDTMVEFDSTTTVINSISATINDYTEATGTDSSVIVIDGIAANITDETISEVRVIENDITTIGSITGQYKDVSQTIEIGDANVTTVGSISMSYVDNITTVPFVVDSNMLSINNIELNITDGYVINDNVTSDVINVRNVTGNVFESDLEYYHTDNNTMIIKPNLIVVDMVDADFTPLITEEPNLFVKTTKQISAKVTDYSYVSSNLDSNYLSNISLTLNLIDPNVNAVTPPNSHISVINTSEIHASVSDYKYKQTTNGADTISISSYNIKLNADDSDIMINGIGEQAITVKNIRMNLNDESDDSQSNP